jgi:hypothetical protein
MGKDNTGTILIIGGLAAAYFLFLKPSQAAAAEGGGGILPDVSGLGSDLSAGLDSLVGQVGQGGGLTDIGGLFSGLFGEGGIGGLIDSLIPGGGGGGGDGGGGVIDQLLTLPTDLMRGLAEIIAASGGAVTQSTLGAGTGIATAATGVGMGIQQAGQGLLTGALAYGGFKLASTFAPAAGRALGLVTTKIAGAIPSITTRVAAPVITRAAPAVARVGATGFLSAAALPLAAVGAAASWAWAGREIYVHRKELAQIPTMIKSKVKTGEFFPIAQVTAKTTNVLAAGGLTTAMIAKYRAQGMTPKEIIDKYYKKP